MEGFHRNLGRIELSRPYASLNVSQLETKGRFQDCFALAFFLKRRGFLERYWSPKWWREEFDLWRT